MYDFFKENQQGRSQWNDYVWRVTRLIVEDKLEGIASLRNVRLWIEIMWTICSVLIFFAHVNIWDTILPKKRLINSKYFGHRQTQCVLGIIVCILGPLESLSKLCNGIQSVVNWRIITTIICFVSLRSQYMLHVLYTKWERVEGVERNMLDEYWYLFLKIFSKISLIFVKIHLLFEIFWLLLCSLQIIV